MSNVWYKEPARVIGIATAILALLVGFGVAGLTNEQSALILAVVVAVVAPTGAEVVRSQVSSPATTDRLKAAFNATQVQPTEDDPVT